MYYADSNCVRIRCGDLEKWVALWNALHLMREVVGDTDNWPLLFGDLSVNLLVLDARLLFLLTIGGFCGFPEMRHRPVSAEFIGNLGNFESGARKIPLRRYYRPIATM